MKQAAIALASLLMLSACEAPIEEEPVADEVKIEAPAPQVTAAAPAVATERVEAGGQGAIIAADVPTAEVDR